MGASFTGDCSWCGKRGEVWPETFVEKIPGAPVAHKGTFCSANCYDSFCGSIEEDSILASQVATNSLMHAQAINGPLYASPNYPPNSHSHTAPNYVAPNYALTASGQVMATAPKPRRRRPKQDKFPEHEHVWTVVEIENNPVGVTCSICDHDYSLSDEPIINLDQVIQLEVGAPVRIKDAWTAANGEKGDAHMRVQDFQVTRTPQGVEIDIRLIAQ